MLSRAPHHEHTAPANRLSLHFLFYPSFHFLIFFFVPPFATLAYFTILFWLPSSSTPLHSSYMRKRRQSFFADDFCQSRTSLPVQRTRAQISFKRVWIMELRLGWSHVFTLSWKKGNTWYIQQSPLVLSIKFIRFLCQNWGNSVAHFSDNLEYIWRKRRTWEEVIKKLLNFKIFRDSNISWMSIKYFADFTKFIKLKSFKYFENSCCSG